MNKRQIMQLIAALSVLIGSLFVFILPILGVDFPPLILIIMLILLIVSAAYLGFTGDIEEDNERKKRKQRFEMYAIVVIVACLPIQFFYPKAGIFLFILFLSMLYWFFFWRSEKDNNSKQK